MTKQQDAVRSLEQAAAALKAFNSAGIKDPAEIPSLVRFAIVAEEFSAALSAYHHAQHAYNRFIATHGSDDPGQEYFVAQLSSAREVYELARRVHAVALEAWRADRGLDRPAKAA